MGVVRIIPILKVGDMESALSFYCNRLGFNQLSLFQRRPNHPAYSSLEKDDCRIHLSSFSGDGHRDAVYMLMSTTSKRCRRISSSAGGISTTSMSRLETGAGKRSTSMTTMETAFVSVN